MDDQERESLQSGIENVEILRPEIVLEDTDDGGLKYELHGTGEIQQEEPEALFSEEINETLAPEDKENLAQSDDAKSEPAKGHVSDATSNLKPFSFKGIHY